MTVPPAHPAPPEKAALSRELADFLIELSISLHKHAMYPEGHPSLAPAAAAVTRRAEHLFEGRATLALGVARQQLVIEGVATDAKNPLLAELAGRLHRHHLGAVTFHRGLRTSEVTDVLKTLALEAERTGEPLGLGSPEQLRAWEHVRLHPVTYERLELLQEDAAAAPADAGGASGRERGLRGAQLWVGLARAALVAEAAADDDTPPPATEPSAIAKAIDAHPRSAAYDQVIVGYLLQIADELKNSGGSEAMALRRRTSKLVGALQPGTLRRLIEMGGDNAQRTKFAIDATHGLAVDAVLDIVRAMADASHKTVSDPLVRMLAKLAQHAEQGTPEARPQADQALREQVRDLLQGWTLDDPNPDAYGQALHRMAAASTPAQQRSEVSQTAEPLRILQTAVETGMLGFAAWRAVERILAENQLGPLVQLLESSPNGSVDQLWTRITAPDVIRQLAGTEPPDFPTLDHVLPRLAVTGFEPLLDVLGTSESRTTRRGLLDRLSRAPRELGTSIAARLAGETPWYVTRNLLLILDGLPVLPDRFSAAAFLAHLDVRVRREAVKLALKIPAERERALLGGLQDADARMVRLALTAALEQCPPAALPLVTKLAQDHATASELRVLAIKVLGRTGNTTALDALLQIVDGGTSWLGRARLAARSLEVLAALMALSTGWRNDKDAVKLLTLAAASEDPDVRNAAIGSRR